MKLPRPHWRVLQFVSGFLLEVSEHQVRCWHCGATSLTRVCWQDMNKMSVSNLAIVFGPNLLWSDDQSFTLMTFGHVNKVVSFIVENHRQIFDS